MNNDNSYNNGVLKYLFSHIDGRSGEWLERHRQKALIGLASTTAVIDYMLTNSSTVSSLALLVLATAIAHDASEDTIEITGDLKESQNLSSGVVGTAVGFGHTVSEGVFSSLATIGGNTDLAVSSVMGSNASHILLMAGGAAVIGGIGRGQETTWKLHALGIAGLSGAFGYQIVSGEFNPYLGAAMIGGGTYYLYNRVISGETCAIHGDSCAGDHNHNHDHEHGHGHSHGHSHDHATHGDHKGHISHEEHDHSHHGAHAHRHEHSGHRHPPARTTLYARMTDPLLLKLGGSVVALTASAHVLGHQVLAQADLIGISTTAAGAGIAALAFAAPELTLTLKAAAKAKKEKGYQEMAWGAVAGCTVATIGVVGGGLALSGAGVPANLDIGTTEGQIHMAAFAGSAGAIVAATHPWIIKRISPDAERLPRWLGGAFLAAGLAYYANITQPNCHYTGPRLHCHGTSDIIDMSDMPEDFLTIPGLAPD